MDFMGGLDLIDRMVLDPTGEWSDLVWRQALGYGARQVPVEMVPALDTHTDTGGRDVDVDATALIKAGLARRIEANALVLREQTRGVLCDDTLDVMIDASLARVPPLVDAVKACGGRVSAQRDLLRAASDELGHARGLVDLRKGN